MKLRFKKTYTCEKCGRKKKTLFYGAKTLRCAWCFKKSVRCGSYFYKRKMRIKAGEICKLCGVIFTKAHGREAICVDCWDFANKQQQRDYLKAIHPEIS